MTGPSETSDHDILTFSDIAHYKRFGDQVLEHFSEAKKKLLFEYLAEMKRGREEALSGS